MFNPSWVFSLPTLPCSLARPVTEKPSHMHVLMETYHWVSCMYCGRHKENHRASLINLHYIIHNFLQNVFNHLVGNFKFPASLWVVRSIHIVANTIFFSNALKNLLQKFEPSPLIMALGVPNLEKIFFSRKEVTLFRLLLGSTNINPFWHIVNRHKNLLYSMRTHKRAYDVNTHTYNNSITRLRFMGSSYLLKIPPSHWQRSHVLAKSWESLWMEGQQYPHCKIFCVVWITLWWTPTGDEWNVNTQHFDVQHSDE